MIRNILLDMGGVVVHWNPEMYMELLGPKDSNDRLLLMRETYKSVNWIKQDRGYTDEDYTIQQAYLHLPARLHSYVEPLVKGWPSLNKEVEGMYEIGLALKANGYELYLLTNASKAHHVYFPKYRFYSLVENHIFLSADVHLLKPEPEYFHKALETFGLNKEECLFIDDNAANIEEAQNLGMDALVFYQDIERLKEELREKGIRI